jgi:hypothetical protein
MQKGISVTLLRLASYSRCGRVVKASDSKSDSLWERRFESYHLRVFACLLHTLGSSSIEITRLDAYKNNYRRRG